MQYFVTSSTPETEKTDCVVIAVYEESQLSPSASTINTSSNGQIQKLIDRGDITGKIGQTLMLQDLDGMNSPRVLIAGCGKQNETTENSFNTIITSVIKALDASGANTATSYLNEIDVKQRSASWKTS